MKKDKIVKIALDARKLNKAIVKQKNQMPNMDHLIDLVAEQLGKLEGEARFTSLDMQYAYGQTPLDTKQLNNVISKKLVAKPPARQHLARDFMDSPQYQRSFKRQWIKF